MVLQETWNTNDGIIKMLEKDNYFFFGFSLSFQTE